VTELSRAVFLSYASQDARAAQRICDALRAAGVEVWLDKSELRGGDAWDRQIRERIHDCRLFIAVISAHTEARDEGYFRREWKLAVDRTRDMSGNKAFIVPVVIDNTQERGAAVPDGFHEVQWTRLRAGRPGPEFVEHVRQLLAREPASSAARPTARAAAEAPAAASAAAAAALPEGSSRRPRLVALASAAVVLACLAAWVLVEKPWRSTHTAAGRQAASDSAMPASRARAVDPSIAVLPFINMSADKAQDYFADGLAEELLDLLAKTPGLHVIARTSSFSFKGKSDDIATIAAKLKVANILEGSVRKSGNRLRVTAQLIRADTSDHLWSDTFERELSDVFKVQDEIAGAVVAALKVHLLPAQQQALRSELHTTNLEAYDLYLQGKQSYNRGDPVGYQHAATTLRQATALDPGYAAAYAALALAEFWVGSDIEDPNDSTAADERAFVAAEKAVALAPGDAAGYSARGFLRAIDRFDFAGAQSDLGKAVALNPGDANVLHRSAVVLAVLGDLPGAIDREQQALALDPLAAEICMRLAFLYTHAGRSAEARPLFDKALAIAPSSVRAHYNLGDLELFENRPEAALAAYRQVELEGYRLPGLAKAEYSLGHAEASQRILNDFIARHGDDDYFIAMVYAWRGETDKAFEWLERSYAARESGLTWIKIDRNFQGLRDDPRYKNLLREMGLPE
jgi:TolB-like protein/Flp pilus assembly protein TadD